jgi:hypothetical protein
MGEKNLINIQTRTSKTTDSFLAKRAVGIRDLIKPQRRCYSRLTRRRLWAHELHQRGIVVVIVD